MPVQTDEDLANRGSLFCTVLLQVEVRSDNWRGSESDLTIYYNVLSSHNCQFEKYCTLYDRTSRHAVETSARSCATHHFLPFASLKWNSRGGQREQTRVWTFRVQPLRSKPAPELPASIVRSIFFHYHSRNLHKGLLNLALVQKSWTFLLHLFMEECFKSNFSCVEADPILLQALLRHLERHPSCGSFITTMHISLNDPFARDIIWKGEKSQIGIDGICRLYTHAPSLEVLEVAESYCEENPPNLVEQLLKIAGNSYRLRKLHWDDHFIWSSFITLDGLINLCASWPNLEEFEASSFRNSRYLWLTRNIRRITLTCF